MLAAKCVASRIGVPVAREIPRKLLSKQVRSFGIRPNVEEYFHFDEPTHPNYTLDSVKAPEILSEAPPEELDPLAFRKPVTSASAIDLVSKPPKLSPTDSVSLTSSGTLKHGRYGVIDKEIARNIPMEYFTMLHPSTQAAAALRTLGASSGGTVLIYGASQPAGIAATQLASNLYGAAVVAVVDSQHGGDDDLVDTIKGIAKYPGTAVAENYVTLKANFRNLVRDTVNGTAGAENYSVDDDFLPDFKQNLMDYCKMFPSGKAAVDPSDYNFSGKESDRQYFKDNMEAYLDQFAQGAPEIRQGELEAAWNKNQYAVFKGKFGTQVTELITDDVVMSNPDFDPPYVVKEMLASPEDIDEYTLSQKPVDSAEYFPYEFNVLHNSKGDYVQTTSANPLLGAIIVPTPTLVRATEAVAKAKTLREKAEALQFLTMTERTAFDAATHIISLAHAAGKEVLVVGDYSLPNLKSVQVDKSDVQTALSAMEVDEEGNSKLNFFMHIYRASDFPIYESYAIHKASQPLAGARQIVVMK